jgi:hypothetical protein
MNNAASVQHGRPISYVWGLQFERSERRANGKYDATCLRPNCRLTIKSASVHQLEEHVLACIDPLNENIVIVKKQREDTARQDGPTTPAVGGLSDLKAVRAKQSTVVQHLGRRLTGDAVDEVHRALLRWAVAHNIPFNAFSCWLFLAFVMQLNDSYVPPSKQALPSSTLKHMHNPLLMHGFAAVGRQLLGTRLLSQEYALVTAKQLDAVSTAKQVTFSIDGYTSGLKKSVYAATATTVDKDGGRQVFAVGHKDLSGVRHTAAAVAGEPLTYPHLIRASSLATAHAAVQLHRWAAEACVSHLQVLTLYLCLALYPRTSACTYNMSTGHLL